ncbi:hypothetical protein [Niveispirillum sp.]|uniref:hypothetical protein n=1 Tax=Niveispirillum sp. TaxID=1917217 RepID=UPI001B5B43A5|nr:hypothetical protein [Niveispirillum sp.]MBP7335826.1 hypothetical protein [Niveispirillum sp.]
MAMLGLSGCAQLPVPDIVFDDGPAPAKPSEITDADPVNVLTGTRPIRRADPSMKGRANLGTVPPRPEEFSNPIERQALMDRLQADREEGQATGDALRARSTDPRGRPEDLPDVPDAPPPAPQALPRPPEGN